MRKLLAVVLSQLPQVPFPPYSSAILSFLMLFKAIDTHTKYHNDHMEDSLLEIRPSQNHVATSLPQRKLFSRNKSLRTSYLGIKSAVQVFIVEVSWPTKTRQTPCIHLSLATCTTKELSLIKQRKKTQNKFSKSELCKIQKEFYFSRTQPWCYLSVIKLMIADRANEF